MQQHPLCAVGRPDPGTIPRAQSQRRQASRHALHFARQLGKLESYALMPHNQRLAIGISRCRPPENFTNSLFNERTVGPFGIAQHGYERLRLSSKGRLGTLISTTTSPALSVLRDVFQCTVYNNGS